jgi:hypothetical protein
MDGAGKAALRANRNHFLGSLELLRQRYRHGVADSEDKRLGQIGIDVARQLFGNRPVSGNSDHFPVEASTSKEIRRMREIDFASARIENF